jgi:hypothetical protein
VAVARSVAQRHHLRVRAAGLLRRAATEHAAVFIADHAADPGVRIGDAEGAFGQGQRVLQALAVERRHERGG